MAFSAPIRIAGCQHESDPRAESDVVRYNAQLLGYLPRNFVLICENVVMSHFYRLVVSCPDRLGIVARVSNFIAGHGGSITEASQHSDLGAGRFFMRYEILADSIGMSLEELRDAFAPVASNQQQGRHFLRCLYIQSVDVLGGNCCESLHNLCDAALWYSSAKDLCNNSQCKKVEKIKDTMARL